MKKNDLLLKKIYYIMIGIYFISMVYGLITTYLNKDMSGFSMGILAIFTPLIIPIIFKLFRYKPVYEIYIINVLFVYFASLMGSTYHWYRFAGFDKVLHFSSGLFLTIGAIIVYFAIQKQLEFKRVNDYKIFLIFINALNLAIAAFWEFYEYALLVFFNNDAINHYTQGVHDAMSDMLVAFIGGLLITYLVHHSVKHQKDNFITNLYKKFYVINIKGKSLS